jgi:cytochrome c-type biogenesis protein
MTLSQRWSRIYPFSIVAALPLLLLATLSREALMPWRGRMPNAAGGLKMALGALPIVAGMTILTGVDRSIQTALENRVPDWVTNLTTRF